MRFFYGVSMQQIIKIQVKLSKRKIAVLYLLYAINAVVEAVEVVSDAVTKKIIKISVKVVPVENKESTSAGQTSMLGEQLQRVLNQSRLLRQPSR